METKTQCKILKKDSDQKDMDHPFIIKTQETSFKPTFGIGHEFFTSMKKYKNNVAIHHSNETLKYDYMLEKSIRVALTLKLKNLGDDPIVAICTENNIYTCIPFAAALFLGYKVASYDGSLPTKDLSALLKQVPPSIIFIDEKFVTNVENAMKESGQNFELVVFGKSEKYSTVTDFFSNPIENEENFEPVKLENSEKTAVILFSSGTTGLPKGICLSHFGFLAHCNGFINTSNISEKSVIFYTTTFCWITSVMFLITSILSGATRVISPISETLQTIHKYKVTHLYTIPYNISSILNQYTTSTILTYDSVDFIMTAGGKLPAEVRSKLEKIFPNAFINNSYGLTEAGGGVLKFNCCDEDINLSKKNPNSGGRPISGFCYKVVDIETGKIQGPNEIGELRLKCIGKPIYMNGFYNKDSSHEFDENGWFKTGDLVYYDEDQCFFITGRSKEMFSYRSHTIRPHILEEIIESHPAVNKAIVVGKYHEIDMDHPVGIVVLNKNYENTPPKEIELFLEERVEDGQRLRGGVKIIKEIPLTSTGKPKRALLKQWVDSGKI